MLSGTEVVERRRAALSNGRASRAGLYGLLVLAVTSCARPLPGGDASFTVSLRQPDPDAITVTIEITARANEPIVLSAFSQAEALRLEGLSANRGAIQVPVATGRDDRGFGRFTVGPGEGSGPVTIRYVVRPGAVEEARMAGPTGHRLGYLDREFGLFGGRQIFLLPLGPRAPTRIRVRFLPVVDQEIVTPWTRKQDDGTYVLTGEDATARLLEACIGVGRFEKAATTDGRFSVHAAAGLPEESRQAALRRALALESFLAEALGRPPRPYSLILVPKSPDGMYVSVRQGPDSWGLSLGQGVPTRWLSIGRAIGRAYLDGESWAAGLPGDSRWVAEALPIYLATVFSERDGWRSRRSWYERFYYDTAPRTLNLRQPEDNGDQMNPQHREWRGALILERLSRAVAKRGGPTIETLCRSTLGRGGDLSWPRFVARELPEDLRMELEGWLSPAPRPFPFPGTEVTNQTLDLPLPPALPAATRPGSHVDLYLGGRNFGLLEQCGCRSQQKGGMGRRATVLRARLRRNAPALALDLGDAVPFDQNAPLLDAQKIAESDLALSLLAYSGTSASVVGFAELAYGRDFLLERGRRRSSALRLLSGNVRVPGLELTEILEWRRGGVPLGIIGLLDPDGYNLGRAVQYEDATEQLVVEEPVHAVKRLLERRSVRGPVVLAGPLGPSAILGLHQSFPDMTLIITDDYSRFYFDSRFEFERPIEEELATMGMLGSTLLVVLRAETYGIVHLALALNAAGAVTGAELEDLELGDEIADDPLVRERLDAHYVRLAAAANLAEVPPIGIRLRERLNASYVGATDCAPCHAAETEQWRGTSHASAFATMLERRRQGVPGCFACHVTGYRQPGGYKRITDLALRHVQCEACHGPGSRHIAEPARDNIVRLPGLAVCRECHNTKHSDMTDENFDGYWARIVHADAAGEPASRD